jgi:hypothetical protein
MLTVGYVMFALVNLEALLSVTKQRWILVGVALAKLPSGVTRGLQSTVSFRAKPTLATLPSRGDYRALACRCFLGRSDLGISSAL